MMSSGSVASPPIVFAGPEVVERRGRRPQPPADVEFPVAPMLDMSFQLLAFFILTFQAPSRETRIDLYLPVVASALPGVLAQPEGAPRARPAEADDLENDLIVRARADELGDLRSLTLLGAEVPDAVALGERLKRYVEVMGDEPVRVRLVADESLRYEEAAKLVGACSAAGVVSLRLGGPDDLTAEERP